MGYADAEAVWRLWHKGKPLPPCVSGVWQCVSCAVLAAVMSWAEHALLLSGLISSPVGAAAGSFCWGAAWLLASLGKKNGAEQRFAVRCVLIASPKANGWEQSSWAQCPAACPLCLRFEHQHHHGWQSILMRCFLGGWALNVICSLISQVATGFMMSSCFLSLLLHTACVIHSESLSWPALGEQRRLQKSLAILLLSLKTFTVSTLTKKKKDDSP